MKNALATLAALLTLITLNAQAPRLTCITASPSGADTIKWQSGCATPTGYRVYASSSIGGPYADISGLLPGTNASFVFPTANSGTNVWYYHVLEQCGGNPPTFSDTLDNRPPVAPQIESVTALVNVGNGATAAQITWRPSRSPQTRTYNMYIERPAGSGVDVSIPTGTRIPDTFFVHSTSEIGQHPERYTVRAVDACNSLSLRAPYHRTMFLSYNLDACTGRLTLTWNHYKGWGRIREHQVYLAINGTNATLAATLGPQDSSYVLTQTLADNDFVTAYITAIQDTTKLISSSSQRISQTFSVNRRVDYAYLTGLNVLPAGGVELQWLQDIVADMGRTEVFRSEPRQSTLTLVAPIINAQPSNTFIDPTQQFAQGPLFYRIDATDRCNNVTSTGLARTVFLEGYADTDNGVNQLQWSFSLMPFGAVTSYELFEVGNPSPITSIAPASALRFTHIPNIDTATTCYYVESRVQLSLPDGQSIPATNRSNIICLTQKPKIQAPTAFVPKGVNRKFNAVLAFGKGLPFYMAIFDRWGERVFETTNADEGWNGISRSGTQYPDGQYLYYIKVGNQELRGGVQLLK